MTDRGDEGLDSPPESAELGLPIDVEAGSEPLGGPITEAESLEARLERLERDREFLLLHSRNLERELWRQLRQHTRHARQQSQRIAEQARQIAEQARQIAEQAQRNDEQAHRIQKLVAELAEIATAHQAVITSRSWRVLGPYRAFRRLLRRLVQP